MEHDEQKAGVVGLSLAAAKEVAPWSEIPTLQEVADGAKMLYAPEVRQMARDLIAAQSELHKWRNGHQLGALQEELNAMQGRATDAESAIERVRDKIYINRPTHPMLPERCYTDDEIDGILSEIEDALAAPGEAKT